MADSATDQPPPPALVQRAQPAPAAWAPDIAALTALSQPADLSRIEGLLKEYHRRYPTLTRLVVLGTTHEHRPITALAISRDISRSAGKPVMLLSGGHHGSELLSIGFVLDAIDLLLRRRLVDPEPRAERWLSETVLWCVPVVNPDGVWAFLAGAPRSGRKNGRDNNRSGTIDKKDGVDLNRNYPFRWGALGEHGSRSQPASAYYRGPAPASEPETAAMMALARRERPVAAISYHTGSVALLAPYTIDGARSPTPNEAWLVAEQVVARMPQQEGQPFVVKQKLYPVDGTDQDYYRATFGTVALILEGARQSPRAPPARRAALEAVRPAFGLLLERYLDGPTVYGQVRDARGRPVAAKVSLAEVTTYEGESWTARPRDGRYDRFLPGPGRYTVRAQMDGRPATAREAPPGDRPRSIDREAPQAPRSIDREAPPGDRPRSIERIIDVQTGRVQVDLTLPE